MRLFEALFATWAPAETRRIGGWTLRRGEGGGNRVSAATCDGPGCDVAEAEATMRAWGQRPTFMIRPGDAALDARLAARGYPLVAPTLVLVAPPAALAPAAPDPRTVRCAAPLAVMREIWAAGGVGPSRWAAMARAVEPKCYLLARSGDRPAACAFVARDRDVAMLQALQVAPPLRRAGLGTALVRAAADWAVAEGAAVFSLAVEADNAPARALYAGLSMEQAAAYHYRLAAEPPAAGPAG